MQILEYTLILWKVFGTMPNCYVPLLIVKRPFSWYVMVGKLVSLKSKGKESYT